MPALPALHAFDLANALVSLWTFRKSKPAGASAPTYTGHWVEIGANLAAAVRQAIEDARAQVTEEAEYDLLAQNNEASVLTIPLIATHADRIVAAAMDEVQPRKARRLKDLQNTSIYAFKLVSGPDALFAVSKANDTWKSKKRGGIIPVVFDDESLDLEINPAFSVSRYFDFFILNDDVIILDKRDFESILDYKQAHLNQFSQLQSDPDFLNTFSSLTEIASFVGSNKMHLRRAYAIHEKGHFRNQAFMTALRQQHQAAGLTINYDSQGRIVPCSTTCPDIFKALLDHRLVSLFSNNKYDVPSTAEV